MCDLLTVKDQDIILVLLKGIKNVLVTARKQGDLDGISQSIAEYDGLEKIEDLQNHENGEVSKKAHDIMITFFTDDNEDEVKLPENFTFSQSLNETVNTLSF
jgi:importin subunit alpha-2